MKKMKVLVVLLLALMMALSLVACNQESEKESDKESEKKEAADEKDDEKKDEEKKDEEKDDSPIYFAWVGPLTGDAKQYGDTEKIAVELALKEINEVKGGVLGGRKIEVDFYDDKNDAKEAVTIANKIVGDGKYSAVIGHFSSTPSMAAAPIYEEAKLVQYSPTASNADYSSLGKFIFRNTPTQAIETAYYAEYVYNNLGIKSVGILYVNDDWGLNIKTIFVENFEKLGGEITAVESFIPNQTSDFSPMITKIQETKPEAFFPVGYYADSAKILQQADNVNFDVQMILSSSTLKPELIELAGELAEGCFLMNAFTPDIPTDRFKKVMADYTEITGKSGDAFVMQTYDVVAQLATAIEKAGSSDPEAIRDALDGMTYECLAGEYTMNELGDAVRSLQPVQVKDGKFVNIGE